MSDESRKAKTLRTAGFNARTGNGGITYFLDGNGVCWSTNEALVIAAAERAREDRALLATLAAGVEASLTSDSNMKDEAFGKYVRRRFTALYGRAPEIGTPPADDDAAKVARVEALAATWENGSDGAAALRAMDLRAILAGSNG